MRFRAGLSHAGVQPIGMDVALDPEKLKKAVGKEDTVAVFGSSHSAVLVLASLLEGPVKKVINFYRSPHRYAVYLEDWILFDDTGLKAFTAKWAKKHLDGENSDFGSMAELDDRKEKVLRLMPYCLPRIYRPHLWQKG